MVCPNDESLCMYRIGFDAKRLFHNYTGLGNYSRTLVHNLATCYPEHAYHLYTPSLKSHSEIQSFLGQPPYHIHTATGPFRAYWRTIGILKDLRRHQVQLYHGLSHEIPIGIHRQGIPSIVTIHDLVFKHYPSHFPWLDRQLYDFKFRYACRHSNLIIAISESTRKDIVEFYNIPAEKVAVVYQSCHERFLEQHSPETRMAVLQKYQLPTDYLLYVGALIERKNLLGIVQAMEHLPPDLQLPLVVIGNGGAYKRKVQAYIARKRMERQVLFVDAKFEDMPALYQQARIFIYPSVYEGFGIPVLESLCSGTPVIISNVSSLPEAAGPDSWLVDPTQPQEIAAGMEAILSSETLRARMIAQGLTYAQHFRGEVLAQQLMQIYLTLLK